MNAKSNKTDDRIMVARALLSTSDKTGLAELAAGLADLGVELISTGGTARALREHGLTVSDVSAVTGFPEIMDGRVKTLHPAIHGGFLGVRGDAEHEAAMAEHHIAPIDLAVINLYPFEQTVRSGGDFAACVENIDIGGPAMIRAAAKNHRFVTIITDPADGQLVLQALRQEGGVPGELRRRLAAKAFAHTAAYDAAIATWFAEQTQETAPQKRILAGTLSQVMRYGENPHQSAAFYVGGRDRPGVSSARQVQGKTLSYNNINDTDAAFELVCEFDPAKAAVAIIKHANPCGVAVGKEPLDAYEKALACDCVSAFGGIVALNQPIDETAARKIAEIFTEVVIAPDASPEALEVFAGKKNLRLLLTGGLADPRAPGLAAKTVAGGLLVQSRDNGVVDDLRLEVVTKRQPDERQMADLKFAFSVAKHVKSNAIVYAKDGATVGIGAGQMSRVDSARIAAQKAQDAARAAGLAQPLTKGCVAASDAFFPFADGLVAALEAGATAVIQPGGSMRDDEVIAAADEADIAMVFTGMRHFRH